MKEGFDQFPCCSHVAGVIEQAIQMWIWAWVCRDTLLLQDLNADAHGLLLEPAIHAPVRRGKSDLPLKLGSTPLDVNPAPCPAPALAPEAARAALAPPPPPAVALEGSGAYVNFSILPRQKAESVLCSVLNTFVKCFSLVKMLGAELTSAVSGMYFSYLSFI